MLQAKYESYFLKVSMVDKATLCEKIREIYPDAGEYGIDVCTEYDQDQQRWMIHLHKNRHKLKTFL
jgi:hypothetical protein